MTTLRTIRVRPFTRWSPGEALAAMRTAGLDPIGPYPGRSLDPWPSRCTTCGALLRYCVQDAARGRARCTHRNAGAAGQGIPGGQS